MLTTLLGHWATGKDPLYRQLADRIERLVTDGELAPGDLLPPERILAADLAVSRSTTVAAYTRLAERGLVTRRQGSGTRVAAHAPSPDGHVLAAPGVSDAFDPVLSALAPSDMIQMSAASRLPRAHAIGQVLGHLASPELDALLDSGGYLPYGYLPLRRALAATLADDVPTTADQVLVTNGAQEAISLVTSQLVHAGDAVVTEEATYSGALDAFRASGARVFAARSDEHGVDTEDLDRLVTRTRPALVYLTPTYNNPTGTVLPRERRAAVVAMARRQHVPVIDDLTLSHLHLDELAEDPVMLATLAETGPSHTRTDLVISIDSLDKAFWGGLRVGWVRASAGMIDRLARAKTVHDLGSTPITQLAAVRLLDDLQPIIADRNARLRAGFAQVTALVDELLPSWRYRRPRGGSVLWIRLPSGSARGFAAVALRFGVTVATGPSFCPGGTFADHIRVSFAEPSPTQAEGVRRLAAAWAAYDPAHDAEPGAHRLLL